MGKIEVIEAVTDQALFDADLMLEQYGRWSMDRYKKQRCASAERNYKAPPNDDDRKPAIPVMPDFDAMRVHRAVINVPMPFRAVLTAYYVQTRIPTVAQKRSLGMSWNQFETARVSGVRMFINIYKRNY